MDEVIDLRPTIERLLRYWWIVVGTTLVVVALAVVVSLILPERYEATTLVAITEPTQLLQFDQRFENIIQESPLLDAYPELAISDELLGRLLNQLPPQSNVATIADLRGLLAAESGAEPGLLRLIVRHEEPEMAAMIANTWGQLFVEWANELYGSGSTRQVQFFENQLVEAQTTLEAAAHNLIDFQGENRLVLVENELAAMTELQQAYLADKRVVTFALSDVKALRNQIANSDISSVTFADQVTALILQIKAFGADSTSTSTSTSATTSTSSTSTVPLQFQLDSASVALTSADRAEQLALLDNLATTLENTLVEIDESLVALEPQMLEKQRLYQEIVTENDRLLRDQDVATETYLALARKVDEERILAQDNSGGVRLASGAAVPVQPASSGLLLNVVVAGVVGLGLGLGIALILAWWRGSRLEEYQIERERLNARTT